MTTQWTDKPCKEWKGFCNNGYGRVWRDGKRWRVHRLAWTLKHGEIPEGMYVLHHCDNPACYEVTHLFLGSQGDNMQDMTGKGRRKWASGEDNAMAKVTDGQVEAIRRKYAAGVRYVDLVKSYPVGRTTRRNIILRRGRWANS